ncbi:hypothetical protein Pcinc_019046 [Petrolisthes cinctipes]|uniref:Uncharacterized protein n=1 Tax=Petrolisthes cinctipes TaxID=88211 RepID=A0AAE1FMZ9_PETCI|nr:hypothetical protein Pcinc_019046 [Petrolisthes cinctipes]
MTLRPASPPPSRHLTPEPGTDTNTDTEPVPDISHPEPQIDTNVDPITEAETERPDAIPDPSTNQDSPLQDSPLLQDPHFQDEPRSGTRGKAGVSGRRGEVHVEMADVGLPKLEVVMSPMMIMLRGVGVGPPVWNATRSEYATGFRSVAGAARAVAATSLIFLTVLSTLAIGSHVLGFRVQNENETAVGRRLKMVGVVIVGGYQVNACIQVANTLIAVTRHAHLLTCWNRVIDSQHIPLPPRLRLRCLVQVFFMIFFAAAMVTAAAMGRPRLLAVVLDGLAERLYFIPYTWLSHHPSVTVVRVLVALVAIHHFAINKGVIFYFTTHCHLLTGALATWNTHARHALNGTNFTKSISHSHFRCHT